VILLALLCLALASPAFAESSILSSLVKKGVAVQAVDDASLAKVRGTGIIYDQPLPNYVNGIQEWHVSWKGFGSILDYRNSHIVGGSIYANDCYIAQTDIDGNVTGVWVGDEWWLDTSGDDAGYTWTAAAAQLVEYHYQMRVVRDGQVLQLTNIGLRDQTWNRPITAFKW
jgi:hypothetical protein